MNYEEIYSVEQRENHRKGLIASVVFHALLLLILILPFISFPIPPPGQEGIVVSLGIPDSGMGNDRPETQNEQQVQPTPPSATAAVQKEQPEPEVKKVSERQVETSREVVTTEKSEVVLNKKEDEAEKKKREAELQRQREEAEARREAEMEAKRKAEEEARRQEQHDQNKRQFGDLLSGSGKGATSTPGNQGVADGDPDASKLKGISSGSGVVGGGLSNRGVLYEPQIEDRSQETGRVVINVCVDGNGNVVSSRFTQRGSTTTNADLRALAERSARKFKFSKADIEKQCGTVTIDFKVK